MNTAITVESGQKRIIFVNGDLRFTGTPNILEVADGGFIAFIVSGAITADTGVGNPVGSYVTMSPVPSGNNLEGIFISDGTFGTNAGGNRQVVVRGTVLAGNFSMARNLGAFNANYPAAIFIHSPRLILDMPDSMKDIPLLWEEIAPKDLP